MGLIIIRNPQNSIGNYLGPYSIYFYPSLEGLGSRALRLLGLGVSKWILDRMV